MRSLDMANDEIDLDVTNHDPYKFTSIKINFSNFKI